VDRCLIAGINHWFMNKGKNTRQKTSYVDNFYVDQLNNFFWNR
jgi:hypothetical protein